MSRRWPHAALTLLIGLFASGSIAGETWKGRDLRFRCERSALRVGPLRLQPLFFLRDAGYDSNIYGQVEQPQADYWLQAGMELTAYLRVDRKVIVTISESPRYLFFYETRRERTWNNYLQGEVSLLFNRVFVSGGGLLNNYRYRYPVEFDIWPRTREKGVFGSLLFQLGRRTSLEAGARATRYDYGDLQGDFAFLPARLDRRESFLTATAHFQATPRLRLSLSGEYGRFEFDDATRSYGDAESRAARIGIDFHPPGRLQGSCKIGYKILSPLEAGRNEFAGVVGNARLSLMVTRLLILRGRYVRDIVFSARYDRMFFTSDQAAIGVSLNLNRGNIRCDYDYGFNRYSYEAGLENEMVSQIVGIFFKHKEKTEIGLRAGIEIWRFFGFGGGEGRRRFIGLNWFYRY